MNHDFSGLFIDQQSYDYEVKWVDDEWVLTESGEPIYKISVDVQSSFGGFWDSSKPFGFKDDVLYDTEEFYTNNGVFKIRLYFRSAGKVVLTLKNRAVKKVNICEYDFMGNTSHRVYEVNK